MFANGCFSGVDDVGVGTEFAGSLGRTGGAFSGERLYARGVEGAGRRDMPARGGRRLDQMMSQILMMADANYKKLCLALRPYANTTFAS